ncbi:hypothetical protein [Rummeliibacillus sp. TYF-LIM-RU47]|uniref:hypothetical protein n=1 Tax=Rummeliibacillus sp. TYF-LIM-RU47 TaxID=2608406 RepID=UPI00123B548B|nr:hypothetical protein [Rummeliibacillus sp. TYF-LIM-RU47]
MKEYSHVLTVSSEEVRSYVDRGWEIFETSKNAYPEGGVSTEFHIGYPLRKNYEELLKIIKLYEKHGFKEELGQKVFDDSIDNYDTGREGHHVNNDMTSFLENYDMNVNGYVTKYYKKLSSEEIEEKYGNYNF